MPKTRDQLVGELAELIISSCNLRHFKKEQILAETALMADGLGLDSLDILEIVVSIEQKYSVSIAGPEEGRQIFQTVGTLANYLQGQNV